MGGRAHQRPGSIHADVCAQLIAGERPCAWDHRDWLGRLAQAGLARLPRTSASPNVAAGAPRQGSSLTEGYTLAWRIDFTAQLDNIRVDFEPMLHTPELV